MIDPIIHAALVTVFTWLVQLAFAALGFELDNPTAHGLATVIVGYILSLFGLSLWRRGTNNTAFGGSEYKPPFTG